MEAIHLRVKKAKVLFIAIHTQTSQYDTHNFTDISYIFQEPENVSHIHTLYIRLMWVSTNLQSAPAGKTAQWHQRCSQRTHEIQRVTELYKTEDNIHHLHLQLHICTCTV